MTNVYDIIYFVSKILLVVLTVISSLLTVKSSLEYEKCAVDCLVTTVVVAISTWVVFAIV